MRVASRDAVASLLDGSEAGLCEPPELCTTPERGSAVEASLAEEVELALASTELGVLPDVEPDGEPAAEADDRVDEDDFVDEVESVDDDVLTADSDDELEVDDEPDELVSVGAANATPGVAATAPPTPSATANIPARTMYCAFSGITLTGQSARAPAVRFLLEPA